MDADVPACRNCGTTLQDRYCAHCGQDARELPQALVPLGARLLAGVLDLESRPVAYFFTLLSRPGCLTAAYLGGQRARFAAPVQVYLWCTALFFLAHAYHPFVRLDIERGRIWSSLSAVLVDDSVPAGVLSRVAAQSISLDAFVVRFDAAVSAYLPVLLAGIVVAVALLFELLFRRQRALTHLVFALHFAAFYFTVETVRQVLPIAAAWIETSGMVVMAIVTLYLATAMRAVYHAGWPAAILKSLVVAIVFSVLLYGWIASAIALATRFA